MRSDDAWRPLEVLAISVMLMTELLVASTVSGSDFSSIMAKSSCLSAMSSTAHSSTN